MFPFIGECFGNPSSAHALGRACKAAVVKARARVAALLGCSPEEVVFVASGSEADNHAILASVRKLTQTDGVHVARNVGARREITVPGGVFGVSLTRQGGTS